MKNFDEPTGSTRNPAPVTGNMALLKLPLPSDAVMLENSRACSLYIQRVHSHTCIGQLEVKDWEGLCKERVEREGGGGYILETTFLPLIKQVQP